MTSDDALINRLETYYDAVPRHWADAEEIGPFTLFVAREGWQYYARPRLGGDERISADDVRSILALQGERGLPRQIEWVDDVTPGLAETAESLGYRVERCPLMVLSGPPTGSAGLARVLTEHEVSDLAASRAAISVAFTNGGTETGEAGIAERDAAMGGPHAKVDDVFLARIASGKLRQAAVWTDDDPDAGPVGGGGHVAAAGVAELSGIGILPAYRRRGLAAQVTYRLATDAIERGVSTVFCSAQNDDVARVYAGIGFARVGTACILEV